MIAIPQQPHQAARSRDHERFLELLPAIEQLARLAFRNLQPQAREEAICEVVAYAYCAFHRLAQLGKLDVAHASPLARFGVARFRSGRRVGGRQGTRDVFSAAAQRRAGFFLESLQPRGSSSTTWQEALADNRRIPVLDQVAFRLDFAAWLRTLKRRDRRLVEFLSVGSTHRETAQRFRISQARVSQLRGELQSSWRGFRGEAAPAES